MLLGYFPGLFEDRLFLLGKVFCHVYSISVGYFLDEIYGLDIEACETFPKDILPNPTHPLHNDVHSSSLTYIYSFKV